MSKLRKVRERLNQSLCDTSSFNHRKSRSIQFASSNTIRSKYIPEVRTAGTDTNMDETILQKDKIFNKNIWMFRESFIGNDPSQLPFMSSLRTPQVSRQSEWKEQKGRVNTVCQPFEAGEKNTKNMKVRKRITDLHGRGDRMSTAYYRWHNRSGTNNKQSTNFECSLRDYNSSWQANPEETNFINTIKPIKYEDVDVKIYERAQLICSRQKRLFCLS